MSAASRLPMLGWLFPSPDESGRAIALRTQITLVFALGIANAVGAGVVFCFLLLVLPPPPISDITEAQIVNGVAVAIYVAVGTLIGTLWSRRRLAGMREWLRSDRPAREEERLTVLRAPGRIVGVHVVLWGTAVIFFFLLNWRYSGELAQRVATTVVLGGLTTCAIAWLVSERVLRPAAARALSEGPSDRSVGPGVKARTLLAWTLGTAVPVTGIIMIALSTLVESDFSAEDLAFGALVLAGLTLVVGAYVSFLAARAVADPVSDVQAAVEEVERGELDVEVPVYDGSEIGRLQAGFNRMVAGLRERERIHDLFGRHVGEDVARAALEQEVELGGETRTVSVLFVDVVGSTKIAAERPPQEVVEMLNSFFAVVIEAVSEQGGWINKFEGDAALAIFGAPAPLDDHPDRALEAARELAQRLEEGTAGIGVSCGEVVAGNIGDTERFEYTVIGDPVNEAARLTELAKERGGVLASEAIVRSASDEEAERWELGESVELRGRAAPTRLAKPQG